MTIRSYIQNKRVKHFTVSGIEIFEKDILHNGLSAKSVVDKIVNMVPSHLLINIDSIYIGEFKFLQDKEVQAAYENSSIFVTNEQDTEEDMLDDIIHEIAHSIEEKYMTEIYSDSKLESEFLQKRQNAYLLLKDHGLKSELQNFLNIEYSESFDNFLYHEVGYPMLAMVTSNIFYSPYAITSLREYFANGFEAFFAKSDVNRLKNISPVLFRKIVELASLEEEHK
jgi:hypothetical protein